MNMGVSMAEHLLGSSEIRPDPPLDVLDYQGVTDRVLKIVRIMDWSMGFAQGVSEAFLKDPPVFGGFDSFLSTNSFVSQAEVLDYTDLLPLTEDFVPTHLHLAVEVIPVKVDAPGTSLIPTRHCVRVG